MEPHPYLDDQQALVNEAHFTYMREGQHGFSEAANEQRR